MRDSGVEETSEEHPRRPSQGFNVHEASGCPGSIEENVKNSWYYRVCGNTRVRLAEPHPHGDKEEDDEPEGI